MGHVVAEGELARGGEGGAFGLEGLVVDGLVPDLGEVVVAVFAADLDFLAEVVGEGVPMLAFGAIAHFAGVFEAGVDDEGAIGGEMLVDTVKKGVLVGAGEEVLEEEASGEDEGVLLVEVEGTDIGTDPVNGEVGGFGAGVGEHLGEDVEGGEVEAELGEGDGNAAGAAAEFEEGAVGSGSVMEKEGALGIERSAFEIIGGGVVVDFKIGRNHKFVTFFIVVRVIVSRNRGWW